MKKKLVLILLICAGITSCTESKRVSVPGMLSTAPAATAIPATPTKSTETPTPFSATATPNQQTLEATAKMVITQETTFEVIPLELEELERWQEYEQALSATMFERLHFSDPLCEWQVLGREANRLYLFAACSGYDQDAMGRLHMIGHVVTVILNVDGNILKIDTMENIHGTWEEKRETLCPPDIWVKIDQIPYKEELLQHLADRRETPEPPWIVLYATRMP